MPEQVEKTCGVMFDERPGRKFRSTRATVRTWSSTEIRALRELADAGMPMQFIALKLNRTVSAVRNKAGIHGISVYSAPAQYESVE
jgi:hypothetical protein